jgi:HEAT repeat protein
MLASSVSTERAQVLQAIGQADLRTLAPRVLPSLGDSDIHVRNAAAVTLGLLQDKRAVGPLRQAFEKDAAGSVKMFAAVSLKQLGDPSADEFLNKLLGGQIAEIQVIAAGAWQFATTRSPAWEKAVRALQGSANDLQRIRAAELLARVDPPAARSVLSSALGSPNPLLRAAAAKVVEAQPALADLAVARRLVGDASAAVRIHGAGLALAITR